MPASAFEYFLSRENAQIVKLLEQNTDVSAAIQGVLENLVNFANAKGVPFNKVRMRTGFVIPTEDGDSKIQIDFYTTP